MPPKTELILSPFSPASPGILDHDLPLVAKRRGPRDDQIVPCRVHSTSTIWHREDIERSHSIKRAVACFPDKSLEYILPLSSRKKNMVRTLSSDLAEEYSNPYYNSMSRMESHEPCTAWLSKDPASERTVLN